MEPMHPFTIYHVAPKITHRYIIYTETKTERNKWKVAFKRALAARKSLQDLRMVLLLHFDFPIVSYERSYMNPKFSTMAFSG